MTTTYAGNGHTAGIHDDPTAAIILPPHNIDNEAALLGSIFVDPDRLPELKLEAKMFYKSLHRTIYAAFLDLRSKKKAIDFITVSDVLRGKEIEEEPYLMTLMTVAPTSTNVHTYAKIVLEQYNRRQMISLASTMATQAYDEETPFDDVVSTTLDGVRVVAGDASDNDPVSVYQASNDYIEFLTGRRNNEEDSDLDLRTGFLDLDRLLQGIEAESLVISAGRPGMGKSQFEQAIALYVARQGKRVARFNLEMSVKQMMARHVSNLTRTPYKSVMNPKSLPEAKWIEINTAVGMMSELPMYMDDTPGLSLVEFESKLHRLFADHGHMSLVTIDYLQLMSSGRRSTSRVDEVSQISRGLKTIAKEMETVIFANAQLSRAVEQRHVKKPILADLRDSGTIEQDADVVMFIYRDEYYNEDTERPNIAEIDVAKHRNGPTGQIDLYYNAERMLFADLKRKPLPDL